MARGAAELDGYRRAYGLHHDRPAKHAGGSTAREQRTAAPASTPTEEPRGSLGRRGRDQRTHPSDSGRPTTADRRHRVDPQRLLGAEPHRDTPGRRRDWQQVCAALERLADHHHRSRDDRHRPPERAGRPHGRDLGRQERDGR